MCKFESFYERLKRVEKTYQANKTVLETLNGVSYVESPDDYEQRCIEALKKKSLENSLASAVSTEKELEASIGRIHFSIEPKKV